MSILGHGVLRSFIAGLKSLRKLRIAIPFDHIYYCGAVDLATILSHNKSVLGNFQPNSSLRTATFTGYLCDAAYVDADDYPPPSLGSYEYGNEDGWDLDADTNLAAALGRYMVEGGPCPLHHNSKDVVLNNIVAPI
ncbi:hypothetical protein EK21DRAFT_68814 [Setomelanomma holmii]|uniref:Uncharacterized protein n=1 Tax=Setomelanomma holmii TaxID=210430 RepID=A0A9P4LME6_9PLEO|nr:hypothetical protein EK21DRAFT_68814 [Setomelanomma holmii]